MKSLINVHSHLIKLRQVILLHIRGTVILELMQVPQRPKTALVGEDGESSVFSSTVIITEVRCKLLFVLFRRFIPNFRKMPESHHACSTGYGEASDQAAASILDEGEVETVSHYYAAAFFDPEVDCILDIGGQDMKCIKIKNQTC